MCLIHFCLCVCVDCGHRCSSDTGTLCSLALAPIGWPHHGGGAGASVRLYRQLHHRSVCVCWSVCMSYVFMQALCLARACPSPLSTVSSPTESHTLHTMSPIVLPNDRWTTLCLTVGLLACQPQWAQCHYQGSGCMAVTLYVWHRVSDQLETMWGSTECLCVAWHIVIPSCKM